MSQTSVSKLNFKKRLVTSGSLLLIMAMLAVCLVGVMIFMTIEQTNQIVQQGPVMDATLGTLAEQQKIR